MHSYPLLGSRFQYGVQSEKQFWDPPFSAIFLDRAVEGVVVASVQGLPRHLGFAGGIYPCDCPGKKEIGREEGLSRVMSVPPQLELVFQHLIPQEKVKLGSAPRSWTGPFIFLTW